MTTEEKYEIIKQLCKKNGCLVTYSHPEGVMCSISCDWDEDIEEYIFDEIDVEEIPYKISIWDSCHNSDLGILYCTAENIEINGDNLIIKDGEHVYGGMTESMWDDVIEFKMYIPFNA